MSWTDLPTNYTDAVWSGLKKFVEVDNGDGTVSFQDVTAYTNRENSFFGAAAANQMNGAINTLMAQGAVKWYSSNLAVGADTISLVGVESGDLPSTAIYEVFSQNSSNTDPGTYTVTADGDSATIVFDTAMTEATDFKIRVTIA